MFSQAYRMQMQKYTVKHNHHTLTMSAGCLEVNMSFHIATALIAVVTLALTAPVLAADLDAVLDTAGKDLQLARASQQTIDQVVLETESLESEYSQALKQLDGLQVYNQYMQQQIAHQDEELARLAQSLDNIEDVERQILPLMIRMLDALEEFVELDLPFLKDERQQRVIGLRALMARADVSAAEKFRRLMEAFQIEADFGRTIETYKDTATIDTATMEIDVLRIGRIGLFYQSADAKATGTWDTDSKQWMALGSGARNAVRQGIRMARRQVAPDLLLLPVPAPEPAP
jgi:hypothetical protein